MSDPVISSAPRVFRELPVAEADRLSRALVQELRKSPRFARLQEAIDRVPHFSSFEVAHLMEPAGDFAASAAAASDLDRAARVLEEELSAIRRSARVEVDVNPYGSNLTFEVKPGRERRLDIAVGTLQSRGEGVVHLNVLKKELGAWEPLHRFNLPAADFPALLRRVTGDLPVSSSLSNDAEESLRSFLALAFEAAKGEATKMRLRSDVTALARALVRQFQIDPDDLASLGVIWALAKTQFHATELRSALKDLGIPLDVLPLHSESPYNQRQMVLERLASSERVWRFVDALADGITEPKAARAAWEARAVVDGQGSFVASATPADTVPAALALDVASPRSLYQLRLAGGAADDVNYKMGST